MSSQRKNIELYKRTYILFFNGCVLFSDFLHHMHRSKVDVDIKMVLSPDNGQSCLSYRITFHIATSDLVATFGNCGKFHPWIFLKPETVFCFIYFKVDLFVFLWQRIYLSVTVGFLSSVPADSAVFYITFCFILQHQVCFQIQISSPPLDKFNSRCFASMGLFLIKTWSVFSAFIPAEGRPEERYGYVTVTSDSLERVY